ncbi:MAG: hypothetical protein ABIL49_02605 [candidate division WOR-3 bacterium]|jgi:pyrroloquinoline-quinone synthase
MLEVKFKLLEHPFYRAWEDGKVSINKLAEYGYSYYDFIVKIPVYWNKVLESFSVSDYWIVEEEKNHIELWKKWICKLPKPEKYPILYELLDYFDSLEPSELAGAIYSFEIQQPEVAVFKKECLMKYYNFKEQELEYFDEHMKEEKHIKIGKKIFDNFANKEEFEKAFHKASEIIYKSLDNFL